MRCEELAIGEEYDAWLVGHVDVRRLILAGADVHAGAATGDGEREGEVHDAVDRRRLGRRSTEPAVPAGRGASRHPRTGRRRRTPSGGSRGSRARRRSPPGASSGPRRNRPPGRTAIDRSSYISAFVARACSVYVLQAIPGAVERRTDRAQVRAGVPALGAEVGRRAQHLLGCCGRLVHRSAIGGGRPPGSTDGPRAGHQATRAHVTAAASSPATAVAMG